MKAIITVLTLSFPLMSFAQTATHENSATKPHLPAPQTTVTPNSPNKVAVSKGNSTSKLTSKSTAGINQKKWDLKEILKVYQQAHSVTSDIIQIKHFSLLGKTNTHRGKIQFSMGQLRMEFKQPNDSLLNHLLIVNQSHIWEEKQFSKDFGSQIQVTKIHRYQGNHNTESPIFLLLKGELPTEEFSLSKKKIGLLQTFHLKPKDKKKHPDISEIEVVTKAQKIQSFSYLDDLENKTTYKFNNIYFNKKISKDLFNYSPPKNAKVTTL